MNNKNKSSITKRIKIKMPSIPRLIIIVLLMFFALIIIYPFYSSLLTSIVPYGVAVKNSFLLYPPALDFSAYEFIFSWDVLWYGFRTTFLLVLIGVPYNMFLTVTLAYVLSKPIPGRKLVNLFVVFTMFFQGGLIPGYLLIKNMGLIDSYASMILPSGIAIMNMMIMRSYFYGLPEEMREAAKIDGAGEITILVRIALPLSKPMLATIALYYGVDRWNEWYNGMLFMRTLEKWPLQLHIRTMIQSITQVINQIPEGIRPNAFPTGIQMAGILITVLPVALIYPFLQRYFVNGLTLGGVKG